MGSERLGIIFARRVYGDIRLWGRRALGILGLGVRMNKERMGESD